MTGMTFDRAVPRLVPVFAIAGILLLLLAARWVRDPEALQDAPELTAAHLADPRFAGGTVQISGQVRSVRSLPREMLVIQVYEPREDVYLQVPVFPRLGCLPVRPIRDEIVRIHGSLGTYAGLPQVRPLSAEHVTLVEPPEASSAVTLREASTRIGETLLVGPLRADSVEPFTSRAGRDHFRLRFVDPEDPTTGAVGGVLFGGNAGRCQLTRLRSSDPYFVTADIEEFGGAPSLNVQRALTLPDAP